METDSSALPRRGANLDKIKNGVLEGFMILLALLFFVPVVFVLITAFRPENEIDSYTMIFDALAQGKPTSLTLENFQLAWDTLDFPLVFTNTFVITVVSVAGVVLISSMAAYIMVRTRFKKTGWFLFGFFYFCHAHSLSSTYGAFSSNRQRLESHGLGGTV
jgi:ABC-type glycerol-3-phosphate transport system permease component